MMACMEISYRQVLLDYQPLHIALQLHLLILLISVFHYLRPFGSNITVWQDILLIALLVVCSIGIHQGEENFWVGYCWECLQQRYLHHKDIIRPAHVMIFLRHLQIRYWRHLCRHLWRILMGIFACSLGDILRTDASRLSKSFGGLGKYVYW